MEDEQRSDVKRVRLSGTRFDGGRLPVDSLVELQKYQEVVRIAAVAEWQQEHPGEELPAGLKGSVSLTIDRIDEGSADVFLAFEQNEIYTHYQVEAQDAADAIIEAAYSDAEIPVLPSLTPEQDNELRDTVAQLGATLKPEQSMEFYPGGPDSSPVTITIKTRLAAVERLSRVEDFLVSPDANAKPASIEKAEQSLVGRITALDADRRSFKLVLTDGQELQGWYRTNADLFEDFREFMNSSVEGPLTRITGDLQFKDGNLFRFWDTSLVERIEFDETVWGARLTDFAALATGWDGGEAAQISSVALEGAQMLMRAVDKAGVERPGVFPSDEGGVLIEWASASGVRSIEVIESGAFEMFVLRAGEREGEHSTTQDLTVAIAFIEAEHA